MDNKTEISKLRESAYRELFGVRKPTFDKMPGHGGRPPRLSVSDKLMITPGYYHDCRTMNNIAFDYDAPKSRVSDAVKWAENTLIQNGAFARLSKRGGAESGCEIVVAIADATEGETGRPKKTAEIEFGQTKMSHRKRLMAD